MNVHSSDRAPGLNTERCHQTSQRRRPADRYDLAMPDTFDLFSRSPALLRMPSWLGPDVHEEHELTFEPGDYKITPGERWTVVALKTGETVYSGIGPVEIVPSTGLAPRTKDA